MYLCSLLTLISCMLFIYFISSYFEDREKRYRVLLLLRSGIHQIACTDCFASGPESYYPDPIPGRQRLGSQKHRNVR